MSELVFHKLQFGQEATEGTAVPATIVFPSDPGAYTELDRGLDSPEEDYGGLARHRPGRGNYGVRAGKLTIPGHLRFEDCMRLYEMHFRGGITPSAGTWTYTADETTDTLKSYTIEEGTETQAWQMPGCLVSQLELGFGPLAAPGASPWTFNATVVGRNRTKGTFTASLSAPSNLETMQGHLTALYEGPTSTAFASLSELSASLISYRLRSNADIVLRTYGSSGGSDVPSAHGRKRHEMTFEALIKIATTPTTNVFDVYNASGSVATDRRWRIKVTGSGTNAMVIDHRVRFRAVPLGDRDGEQVYSVSGDVVYDSTLASQLQVAVTNAVPSLP